MEDDALRPALDTTTIRLRRMVPGGDRDRPSMWRAWLALEDFAAVERIALLQPLTIAFSATYLVLALRFWFYGPVLITGTATACFSVAAVVGA